MNHRELILSSRKKAKFAFLSLPEDLQDEIVEGLDSQALTLEAASALVKARGHSLSHEGIAGYYRAVRLERRLLESRQELSRIIAEFSGRPQKEAIESLVNLAIATAATGLADGTVGVKVDLAKLIGMLPKEAPAPEKQEEPEPKGETIPDAETIRKIRERYL